MRLVTDSLRNLTVSLEGRELRLRRGEFVPPLEAGFAQGAVESSGDDEDDFSTDVDEEMSEDPEESINEDGDDGDDEGGDA